MVRCLEILVSYGIWLRTERILQLYWNHLRMVSLVGSYCVAPFKGCQGVTQGYPLSPTIFNIAVDAMIWHWVMLVAGYQAGPEGFVRVVQSLEAFFYANNGLLASSWPDLLHEVLYVLTGIFDRDRLHTNANKTMGVVYQPYCISSGNSEAAYERRMMGVGLPFKERQCGQVQCP